MTKEKILLRLNEIIIEVLELDQLSLAENTKAADVEDWDSIMHVEIIVEIEAQFNIKFTTLEIEQFENVGDIINGISSKL